MSLLAIAVLALAPATVPFDGIDYEVVVDTSSELARQSSDRSREHAPVAESFVAVTTTPRTPRASH